MPFENLSHVLTFRKLSFVYMNGLMYTPNHCVKLSKYRVFSDPYFAVFGLNTATYSVFNPNTGKYGPEKTPCLDNFHAVHEILTSLYGMKLKLKLFLVLDKRRQSMTSTL